MWNSHWLIRIQKLLSSKIIGPSGVQYRGVIGQAISKWVKAVCAGHKVRPIWNYKHDFSQIIQHEVQLNGLCWFVHTKGEKTLRVNWGIIWEHLQAKANSSAVYHGRVKMDKHGVPSADDETIEPFWSILAKRHPGTENLISLMLSN